MKKKLPIGIENFCDIRTEEFYYVDKSGLIKELLDNWGEVNLFTTGYLTQRGKPEGDLLLR